jgi:GYF domain 2
MSVVESDIQWFIARDGKQHGPLSDAEMRKLVELSHLRTNDLLWRQGFPDWRPALSVFPMAAPEPVTAQPPAARPEDNSARPTVSPATFSSPTYPQPTPYAAPQETRLDPNASRLGTPYRATQDSSEQGPAGSAGGARRLQPSAPVVTQQEPEPKRRGGAKRFLVAMLLLAILGGGGYFGFKHKEELQALIRAKTGSGNDPVPVVAAPDGAAKTPAAGSESQSAAVAAATVSPAATSGFGAEFLKRPVWATVKEAFPEWYDARVTEVTHLSAEGKPDDEIVRHLIEALVALRRENSQAALSASTAKHKELAEAFLNNLKQLAQESGDGCYDFISKGETSPFILGRMQDAGKSASIEHQVMTIISAISEGKKTPATHTAPVKADYDMLASELTRLGWTQADMQLFADPKALARAPRDRVCKMLQDWFSAHLAISDPAVQERLLFETLKPVVSG